MTQMADTGTHDDDGFTLVEALVALAIVGLAFVALYEATGNAYSALSKLTLRQALLGEARSSLETMLLSTEPGPPHDRRHDGITWRVRREPLQQDAAARTPGAELVILEAVDADNRVVSRLETIRLIGRAR